MSADQFEYEVTRHRLATMEAFTEWLYANYPIGNGDMLTTLQENGSVQDRYLRDMGLPLDTEIEWE
jgi:UDP-N-acetylglucosamine pyrophosphorylase